MNFEQMLNAQDGAAVHREKMPFGLFYKRRIEKKYHNIVELRPELADSMMFCDALKNDHKWASQQPVPQQMHYELHEDSSGIFELELELGNFTTLAQLLDNNPAAVTGKDFIDNLVDSLTDFTKRLHDNGIYQICFAPQNIFIRKGDNAPLLLCHGSFYLSHCDTKQLYAGFEDYVAPEVLALNGKANERSDIYSLGKLIEYLYKQASMPYEYKAVVKKATDADPSKRYMNVADMKTALATKRVAKRTLFMLLGAVAVTALIVGLYIELVPPTVDVEYIEPVPTANEELDPYDYGFDPETDMPEATDSAFIEEDVKAYQQKAEAIFRKRFTAAANAALSKVYDDKRMSSSEKVFMAGSSALMEDLMNKQTEMGEAAGLTPEQSGRIAQEIISSISAQKQAQLTRKGYIKESESEDD